MLKLFSFSKHLIHLNVFFLRGEPRHRNMSRYFCFERSILCRALCFEQNIIYYQAPVGTLSIFIYTIYNIHIKNTAGLPWHQLLTFVSVGNNNLNFPNDTEFSHVTRFPGWEISFECSSKANNWGFFQNTYREEKI